MKIPVLLVSDGLVHPSLLARLWLRRTLFVLPGYRFRRLASLEALPHLSLDSFWAIVLYVHHQSLSLAALDCLDRFLERGGGLLAVHSASASFKEERRYRDILGGSFVTHGPVEEFRVQPAARDDAVWGDIAPFRVRDELYRHEYDAANRIRLYTLVGEEREPVVWTRCWSEGRVCYCALGHTVSAMRHPAVQQTLQRGLSWVCDQEAP
jgi:type 1 glutamine amidotransferase